MKWFKHMCNARNDAFIQWLEEEYGFEGVGRWWRILELIGEAMEKDRTLPQATYTASFWQKQLNMKPVKLNSYLLAIELQGKWKIQAHDNLITIHCPNILKMRDEYSRKSGHRSDNVAPEKRDRVKSKETEKKESKKEENPAQAPLDFKKIIFTTGMNMIGGESKRSLVGKWLRDYGEANVVTAFLACEKNKPLNPIEYMEGALRKTGKSPSLFDKPKSNPVKDISNYRVL